MKVGLLTEEQKNTLVGAPVALDWYFNPVKDGNTPSNWIISTQEMEGSELPELNWVKSLPLIDWVEPINSRYTPNYFTQFFSGETN